MKKVLFILVGLLFTVSVFAQWSLTGNGGTTNSNFVGTTDDRPLIFKVAKYYLAGFTGSASNSSVSFGFRSLFNMLSYPDGSLLYPDGQNTAFGYQALYSTTTGTRNVANGTSALSSNTTGSDNIAIGTEALNRNTTQSGLVAVGSRALMSNTTGSQNTAIGYEALKSANGYCNTAAGYGALSSNTTGAYNTAIGERCLFANTNGSHNTAIGEEDLYYNTTGGFNVAIGGGLITNTTGSNNTAIGALADVIYGNLTNATAIGANAKATGNNQVRIGNSSVTSIGGQVGWTNFSDGRAKKNIKQDVPGLAFINLLKPVTYNLDLDAEDELIRTANSQENNSLRRAQVLSPDEMKARAVEQKRLHTGFVAQDVEKVAKSIGYDFSGVDAPESENGVYGLRYSEFVMPLVKAVQELSTQNDEKDSVIVSMQNQIENLTELVHQLMVKVNLSPADNAVRIPSATLEQNFPNPFSQSTTIRYTLPQTFRSAKIVVTDASGGVRKQTMVSGSGAGNVTIEAGSLSVGVYSYSLYVDGTLVDTKKMILTK